MDQVLVYLALVSGIGQVALGLGILLALLNRGRARRKRRPPQPSQFLVNFVGGTVVMVHNLKYVAELGPVLEAEKLKPILDLDHRALEIIVQQPGGFEARKTVRVEKDAVETEVFEVLKDSQVELRLYNVDTSGNVSVGYASQSFVALDTIPPDAPGAFGAIRMVGEDIQPDPELPLPPAGEPEDEAPTE